eukprot:GHVT01048219.1.p1 GENE.GHVT01048219.1~~GHVT01048219.1.p1  ORF type:complete len:903 (+),score=201.15 GHVT01048219.1:289-2997(+)
MGCSLPLASRPSLALPSPQRPSSPATFATTSQATACASPLPEGGARTSSNSSSPLENRGGKAGGLADELSGERRKSAAATSNRMGAIRVPLLKRLPRGATGKTNPLKGKIPKPAAEQTTPPPFTNNLKEPDDFRSTANSARTKSGSGSNNCSSSAAGASFPFSLFNRGDGARLPSIPLSMQRAAALLRRRRASLFAPASSPSSSASRPLGRRAGPRIGRGNSQPCAGRRAEAGADQSESVAGSSASVGHSCRSLLLDVRRDQKTKKPLFYSRVQVHRSIDDRYVVQPTVLGTGMSGAVRKAVHRVSGKAVAVKSLPLANLPPKQLHLLCNEVAVYLQLDHPNICKLLEVYEDQHAIHLVMELCSGKELYDRLASRKKYSEADALRVARDMLSAINYCHRHNICHRDLKLENWVYLSEDDDAPLKLIDFGFSRFFNRGIPMTAMHGTVYYVSPEVLDGCYDEKCDIWSLGVIVYMLLSGVPPFNASQEKFILAKVKRGDFQMEGPRWKEVSDLAKHFIKCLLRKDPKLRPSACEALRHPWLVAPPSNTSKSGGELDGLVLKSMCEFAASSAIKRAALGLIALSLHSKDVEELEVQFKKLDGDRSGTITLQQLTSILATRLDLQPEECRRIFRRIDQLGDREIHYSEFLASTIQAKLVLDEGLIRRAFERFDVDCSGFISLGNLRSVLGDSYCDEKDLVAVFELADYRKNGKIEYDEFLVALTTEDWTGRHAIQPHPISLTTNASSSSSSSSSSQPNPALVEEPATTCSSPRSSNIQSHASETSLCGGSSQEVSSSSLLASKQSLAPFPSVGASHQGSSSVTRRSSASSLTPPPLRQYDPLLPGEHSKPRQPGPPENDRAAKEEAEKEAEEEEMASQHKLAVGKALVERLEDAQTANSLLRFAH